MGIGYLIGILLGVCLYAFIIGLLRYYESKKTVIYYNGIDAFIIAFYSLFSLKLNFWSYTFWLFACCFALAFLGVAFKPIGKWVFEKKFYLLIKDSKK